MVNTMFTRLKKYSSEPLFHFAIMGIFLYTLVEAVSPQNDNNPNTIKIEQEIMVRFLQFQNKSFNIQKAQAKWLAMPQAEKSSLIDDYIREEVMYREALSMGLEEDDQIIRRRLIQKIEFINRGFQSDVAEVSETELDNYFKENIRDFKIDAAMTFTHVFFDSKIHGSQAEDLALDALTVLKQQKIPFENASRYGERFFFHRNYVDRTPAFVASHFGDEFSKQIFTLKSGKTWYGPINSKYGSHLVMVSKNQPERLPELAEVAGQVLEILQREKMDNSKQQAVAKMVVKYKLAGDETLDQYKTSQKSNTEMQAHVN